MLCRILIFAFVINNGLSSHYLSGRKHTRSHSVVMACNGAVAFEPTVKDLDQDAGSEVIETESLCLNCHENVNIFIKLCPLVCSINALRTIWYIVNGS